METSHAKRARRPTWRIIAEICALVVIVYPLSVGPVARLAFHGYLPGWLSKAFFLLYLPLHHIAPPNSALGAFLRVWANLWRNGP